MSAEEKPTVETFIEQLEQFSNVSYSIAKEHSEKGNPEGLAAYYYGRCISCFVGMKTIAYSFYLSGKNADFPDIYVKDVLPASFPKRNAEIALKYISEAHMVNRFALFQNFYSQTEFTYRIIQRKLYPEDKTNPFKLIVNKYGIMSKDFADFINYIRNTIHNNGYFFPSNNIPEYTYSFNGKDFNFKYGDSIDDLTMEDILQIITYVLEENKKLFEVNELSSLKFE